MGNLSEGPRGGGEFEWETKRRWGIGGGDQQVVGNLSEGTSRWWGVWVRGPAGGGEFG